MPLPRCSATTPIPRLILAIVAELAVLAGCLLSWYTRGRSARVSALAREFTRTGTAAIPSTSFKISESIATQIAAVLGYALTHRSTHRHSGKPVLHFQRLR